MYVQRLASLAAEYDSLEARDAPVSHIHVFGPEQFKYRSDLIAATYNWTHTEVEAAIDAAQAALSVRSGAGDVVVEVTGVDATPDCWAIRAAQGLVCQYEPRSCQDEHPIAKLVRDEALYTDNGFARKGMGLAYRAREYVVPRNYLVWQQTPSVHAAFHQAAKLVARPGPLGSHHEMSAAPMDGAAAAEVGSDTALDTWWGTVVSDDGAGQRWVSERGMGYHRDLRWTRARGIDGDGGSDVADTSCEWFSEHHGTWSVVGPRHAHMSAVEDKEML